MITMHFFSFIKYFFYLAANWNIAIAWHIIKNEIKGEKKYGINTTGADDLRLLENKGIDITHATIYMPASYDILENIFHKLNMPSIHHFIDIGCGKGRALCVAAYLGVKKVTGIDFSKEFCALAIKNLQQVEQHNTGLKSSIINNDAFYYQLPDDADCLFFFNPFDETIMSGVIQNIAASLKHNPRNMTIVYLNPLHKELLKKIGFVETYHIKKMNYLEGCILKKSEI